MMRIYEDLALLGYAGGYDAVRRYAGADYSFPGAAGAGRCRRRRPMCR